MVLYKLFSYPFILSLFLFLLVFNASLFSQATETKEKPAKKDLFTEEDENSPAVERFRKREFELGVRFGLGYHAEDRFESQLRNYKSESSPYILTSVYLSPIRSTTNTEILARIRFFDNGKAGFVYGNTQFKPFHLSEVTSLNFTNFYTASRLNFNLKVEYFFLTYTHEFKFRNFYLEGGMGLGINTISWKTNGDTISRFEYTPQSGFMVGNGLGYKLEGSFNKKVTDNWILQIGSFYNYYTVPSFSGQFNDETSSFYLRSDGSIAPLSTAQFRDSIVDTNYASRQLDMRAGNLVLFLSLIFRFSL
ncbi:MAG TPA: hypothetical protein PLS71_25515 [Leptospiraceae bacterium]|nr:hypothetical protein [Leptospiraceae bacterium]